ncbi:streptomycin 6-kinase [Deinococcus sp. HSC-46F16]|uniref:aminoglycoside phosphotransferase family protein n=1 Tax=Deinococcus sp. HSC-46F16 TaxID=2910968 RepID=UPI00209EA2D0|nr:aminoglycoside phosphotransferase family protein [Deinococcus sp. HSC-46F16]MCP2014323.1 streptomycin 6-kinase [Deinococcus sp. HSC-46F16]
MRTVSRSGEAGRRWLESLPTLVAEVCATWGLEVEGPARHGEWGLVFAVRGAGTPAVLKVTWPSEDGSMERAVKALTLWDGRGAVRLLRADTVRQALLLERLDSTADLSRVGVEEALPVAGSLLRRLAVPAPASFPSLAAVARRVGTTLPQRWEQQGRPLSRQVVERAVALASELAPSVGNLLVNWDIHDGNVLRAEREPWLVTDPQVLAGDLEYGVAQLLWWGLEEIESSGGVRRALDRIVDSADLDADLTRAWTYVRTLDYWLWGLEAGLTVDPPRCERVIESLGRVG